MKKIIAIIISISIFFMSVNIFSNTTPQTPPPPTGDWDIFDTTVINNSVIVLNGNLTVHPSGSLTLDNVTLIMNCTYDGEFGIIVNGTLEIINGTNITAYDAEFNYDFSYGHDSKGNITNSIVEYCGYMGGSWGIKIESDNITIMGSKIKYGYIGAWSAFSPSIVDNTFYLNSYIGISLGINSKSIVSNNTILTDREDGVYISGSCSPIIENNRIISIIPPSIIGGTGIRVFHSSSPIIQNNTIVNMSIGIDVLDSALPEITNNTILHCRNGIWWLTSSPLVVSDNIMINITKNGIGFYSPGIVINNKFINTYIAFDIVIGDIATIINCTIINSSLYDLDIESNSHAIVLNTSYNESKLYFNDMDSSLTTQWFLHVNTTDYLGNPVSNANVRVMDNENGSFNKTYMTGPDGYSRWIIVNESWQNQTHKVYYSPHNVMAWNNTLVGNAQPFINEIKTVNIVLNNGTVMNLEPGWNLISLPLIQTNQNLTKVLEMIDGYYDAVQWYDISDTSNPWEHNKVGKPFGNDLIEINETMGLWIHITQPGDTIFIYNGTQPSVNQTIKISPGWNLVGYPSLSNKNRTNALNNIDFGSDVDAIWTHNATTQTWKEITASDNFEVGRGYWMHSKVTKTWIVPL